MADETPQWERDSGEIVFNAHGIGITVRNDANVTVVVYRGQGKPRARFVGSGTITVGTAGLEIGEIMYNKDLLDWPPGETHFAIYLHSQQPWSARKVSIVLNEAAADRPPAFAKAAPGVVERVATIIGLILQPQSLNYYTAATALKRLGVEAVPTLLEALHHPDDRVRAAAVHALGSLRDSRAVEPLIAALADNEGEVRMEVVRWLGGFRDHRATGPLLQMLALPDPRLRPFVVTSLGELRDARAIPALLSLLQDDDEASLVRQEAARALGEMRAQTTLPDLITLLRDAPDQVRYAIGHTIAAFGRAGQSVLQALTQDEDPQMRTLAVIVLGANRRNPPLALLTRMLTDPDVGVRQGAVGALEQSFNPAALPALTLAARDANPAVRYTAIQGLANVGDTSSLPLLMELRDTDKALGPAGYSIREQAETAIKFIQERMDQDQTSKK